MSRTKRGIAWKHYWGNTKEEARLWAEKFKDSKYYEKYYRRLYLLHGTDAKNFTPGTRQYYNGAHRVGRRLEREQLRPHKVLDENFEFDDSHYIARYKGVWWDIY